MNLQKLKDLRSVNDKTARQAVIDQYLSVETDENAKKFIESIANFSAISFNIVLSYYIDESTTLSIDEIESGKLFELDDISYYYVGTIEGKRMFKQLGKTELVHLLVDETTKVRRVF
jgi:hypothetical protein